ncbi:PDZ domain-containing protein [Parapedomonas caeni]
MTWLVSFLPAAGPDRRRLLVLLGILLVAAAAVLVSLRGRGSPPSAGVELTAPLPATATGVAAQPVAPAGVPAITTTADISRVALHGVLLHPDRRAAILSLADGRQRRVAEGATIAPGLVLRSVSADSIVIAVSGVDTRLSLRSVAGVVAAPPVAALANAATSPQAAGAPAGGKITRAALLPGGDLKANSLGFRLGLKPVREGTATVGYRVADVARMPAFAQLGLRSGDVVLSVNGDKLWSEEKIGELAEELSHVSALSVVYLRDGQRREASVVVE